MILECTDRDNVDNVMFFSVSHLIHVYYFNNFHILCLIWFWKLYFHSVLSAWGLKNVKLQESAKCEACLDVDCLQDSANEYFSLFCGTIVMKFSNSYTCSEMLNTGTTHGWVG